MMEKVKYVRTKNNEIIVFSSLQNHSDFRKYNPVSAGFVSFGVNEEKKPTISCYGESISLRMKSNPEEDSDLAKRQILGFGYF